MGNRDNAISMKEALLKQEQREKQEIVEIKQQITLLESKIQDIQNSLEDIRTKEDSNISKSARSKTSQEAESKKS